MTIKLACSACGKKSEAPDEAAGKRGRCPGCGEIFIVPGAEKKPADPKILSKIEVRDPALREEVERMLEKRDYKVCPYIRRVYDYFSIMGKESKQLAVQCLYRGTVHQPRKLCLSAFEDCEKYQQLQIGEDFQNNQR